MVTPQSCVGLCGDELLGVEQLAEELTAGVAHLAAGLAHRDREYFTHYGPDCGGGVVLRLVVGGATGAQHARRWRVGGPSPIFQFQPFYCFKE